MPGRVSPIGRRSSAGPGRSGMNRRSVGHRQSRSMPRTTGRMKHQTNETILVTRRHRQDRPPRGRAAQGAGRAGADRLALRRAAVRLGRPRHVGARPARRVAPRTSPTTPTSRCPARPRRSARSPSARWRPARGGWCCCPAAARRRPSAPSEALQASGADWTIVRCSWFMQNFSEGYFAEPLRGGRAGAAGRRRARAVRRRRRHRRRRGGRADRGRARRPRLRADRPAAADLRRGGRRDRPRHRPRRCATRRSRWRPSRPGWRRRTCPRT